LTIYVNPVIPIYFKLCDSLDKNLEIVVVAESINDWEG
jgi:hypothetical protein